MCALLPSYRGTLEQFYDLAGILLQHEGMMTVLDVFLIDRFLKFLQQQGDLQVQEGFVSPVPSKKAKYTVGA